MSIIRKFIPKSFLIMPNEQVPIQTRREADKVARKAFKNAIKAKNHFHNALYKKKPLDHDYYVEQLLRANTREKNCLSSIERIEMFFNNKVKLKNGKSVFLLEILAKIKTEMQNLEIRINKARQKNYR